MLKITVVSVRPSLIIAITFIAFGWIALNQMLQDIDLPVLDEPRFFPRGAARKPPALLTLQLGLLNEKNAAKIIELLNEFAAKVRGWQTVSMPMPMRC
jgi:hypothetical protein